MVTLELLIIYLNRVDGKKEGWKKMSKKER